MHACMNCPILLGLYCIRYPDKMLDSEMKHLINDWLTKDCASTKKIEVSLEIPHS